MIFMFDFKKRKQQMEENILGIVFKEIKGKLIVFESSSHGVFLKTTKEFVYSNAIENLIEDIDQQLSILETEGYKDFSSTIYFLDEIFLNERTKEVRESFLPKLREIEEKLSLKPLGYVDINEAIINQIEKENNLPISAIFLNIEKTYFQFILRKAGKNIFEKRIARSDDFLFDFYEGVTAVKDYTPLPIRIIMFDDQDLEKEKNTLINHHFKEEYFIQPPKVEVISPKLIDQYLVEVIKEELITNIKVANKEVKETFDFVIGEDIKKVQPDQVITEVVKTESTQENKFPYWLKIKNPFLSFFSTIKLFFSKFDFLLKIGQMNILFLGFAFIFMAIFVNEYYFHRVKLFITTKKIPFQKKVSFKESEVPLVIKKIDREVKKTVATSGTKLIGEKAKGEIYIYNYTLNPKTISSGTVLTANNLKFILNEEVKIASASYIGNQVGNPLEPAKVKTTITATAIGEESNLDKGTIFQIEGMSSNEVFGKNELLLTGGYKKTVKIFSKKDKEKLKADVNEEIKNYLAISKELSGKNLFLIRDLTKSEFIEENYSHQEEEETESVSLKAKVRINYYFYNQEKLREKIFQLLKKDIPKDYQLKKEKINLLLKKVSQAGSEKEFEFNISGFYNKNIDYPKIQKKLIFLNKKNLPSFFKAYEVERFVLKEENKIPFFSGFLPFFIKNIEIIEN